MAGIGPVPKRSTERRRRNKVPGETTVALEGEVKVPRLPKGMHPIARNLYRSLSQSGQAGFYEPTDWHLAVLLAVKTSAHFSGAAFGDRLRQLAGRVAALSEGEDDEASDVAGLLLSLSYEIPGGSASEFQTLLHGWDSLLITESARRRARLEVERVKAEPEGEKPTSIEDRRKALQG